MLICITPFFQMQRKRRQPPCCAVIFFLKSIADFDVWCKQGASASSPPHFYAFFERFSRRLLKNAFKSAALSSAKSPLSTAGRWL